ncbi:hypothetical protein BCV72DRAFT_338132 [Rhizopus microsporus var. microsporus]|uniref:Uncharacterized protein n=1 Tax=Rhizopus microsporus var. microsporus TaxID=86635 RepID=A0A1X0QU09_RHIZD|nr:hypothetical protein BCV72DRAFT_338132 [Rhizopus microsporus var. microsporus]
MPYNRRRKLFRNENIKCEEYLQKAQNDKLNENRWLPKVQKSDMDIAKYKKSLQKERTTVNPRATLPAMSEDDEADALEITADIHLIAAQEKNEPFKNYHMTSNFQAIWSQGKRKIYEDALSDIKPDELHVCVLITNFLLPYLPSGDKLQHIMHQLLFFLMANDLFRCCGYTHFMVKLVPLTTPHKLLAFKLDASSLYAMFCSKNDEMEIFDFDYLQTKSRQVATDLTFAHNMLVLPGLRTARVNGYLKNQTSVDSLTSLQERHIKRKRGFIEHEQSSNIAVLQANIDALKRQLLQLNSQRRIFLINNNVNKLKNE